MDPLDPALFAASSPCRPCCGGPLYCGCSLFTPIEIDSGIPIFGQIYPNYADAAAAMTGFVASCVAYAFYTTGFENDEGVLTAFTADNTVPNQLTVQTTMDSAGDTSIMIWWAVSLTLPAGAVVSMACTQVSGHSAFGATPTIWLFKCDGTYLYNNAIFGLPANFVLPAVAEDGEYILLLQCNTGQIPQVAVWNYVVTSSTTLMVNPVVAQWDDAGTTRPLEACPKFLLPPLTEFSGDWYATASDANDYIASNTSNCVGEMTSNVPFFGPIISFSATDGGTSLTLDGTYIRGVSTMGSVNFTIGDTPSFNWTASAPAGGYPDFAVFPAIYDYTGTQIFGGSLSGASGSMVFPPMPYTGRYIVGSDINGVEGGGPPASFNVTGIATWSCDSVNPIQALYDLGSEGINCPGRLDCE